MSLDGTFLHCVVSEMLSAGLVGGRIDKIYQPSREEIIISIRSAGKHNKILISSNSMSARVSMTERTAENPSAPPMFCMLLRKHLSGGKLLDITQVDILFSKHKAIHTKRLYLQALRLAFFHFSVQDGFCQRIFYFTLDRTF